MVIPIEVVTQLAVSTYRQSDILLRIIQRLGMSGPEPEHPEVVLAMGWIIDELGLLNHEIGQQGGILRAVVEENPGR